MNARDNGVMQCKRKIGPLQTLLSINPTGQDRSWIGSATGQISGNKFRNIQFVHDPT